MTAWTISELRQLADGYVIGREDSGRPEVCF
jgi:hypothetical protein